MRRPVLTRGYLNTDHAWGGSIDAKYFFHRYFGLGIDGTVLAANSLAIQLGTRSGLFSYRERRAVGSASGTFTFRYPICDSRFAPYAYAGGGAIFGGGNQSIRHSRFGGLNTPFYFTEHTGSSTEPVRQFGGGIEFRLIPNIGIINHFNWNVVNGRNNNFGMVRSGLNFAF